jgi:hypothetical protein
LQNILKVPQEINPPQSADEDGSLVDIFGKFNGTPDISNLILYARYIDTRKPRWKYLLR